MRTKINKIIASILFLVLICPFPIFAATSLPVYEPYKDEEFPSWLKKIRRLEVITLGATALTYPIVGIFAKTGPFNDSTMKGFWAKFGLSAGIGFVIAIADLIIGEVQEKKERQRQEAIQKGELEVPYVVLDPNSQEAKKLDMEKSMKEETKLITHTEEVVAK